MKRIISFFERELNRIIIGLAFFATALVFDILFSKSLPFYIISVSAYVLALCVAGIPVFFGAVKGLVRRDFLDEKFLMSIASVGAMIIGEMSEGVAVMLFFLVGEYFEHRAVAHSRKSIKALMSICPDEATIVDEFGTETIVDASDVEVGSTIVIRAGERIPIDSIVIYGSADVDTSALTGESIPRAVDVGDVVESGTVVLNGVLKCETRKAHSESAASRVLELVENANESKSKEENFITRFSRIYTPVVVGLAIIMATLPPLIFDKISFSDAIYSALTFLVVSCPCALVISVPMAFFGGIGCAAKRGILFKGGNVFSALSRADSFAFDKTGTLTSASFEVSRIDSFGMSEEKLLYYAASAEYGSNHPISVCIKNASKTVSVPTDYKEIAGKGVMATVDGKTVFVGNEKMLSDNGITASGIVESGAVFVAIDGLFVGTIIVNDRIKNEAEYAISVLSNLGVKRSVMLSGDEKNRALTVANSVGIGECYYELSPEQKYEKLKEIATTSVSTAYVGDGINDAPSLALADVGIAMGAIGSDVAIESSDIVIMSDNLLRLPTAVKISRKTLRIAKLNIIFAISVKLAVMILSAIGFANMWLAVFADVGVAVLAILNSMRTLSIKE